MFFNPDGPSDLAAEATLSGREMFNTTNLTGEDPGGVPPGYAVGAWMS